MAQDYVTQTPANGHYERAEVYDSMTQLTYPTVQHPGSLMADAQLNWWNNYKQLFGIPADEAQSSHTDAALQIHIKH